MYIGITNDLKMRHAQHMVEWKDGEELELFYFEANNRADADFWESILINKYDPPKNIAKRIRDASVPKTELPEPDEWIRVLPDKLRSTSTRTILKKKYKGAKAVIFGPYWVEIVGKRKDKIIALPPSADDSRFAEEYYRTVKHNGTPQMNRDELDQFLIWISEDHVPIIICEEKDLPLIKKEIRDEWLWYGGIHDKIYEPRKGRFYIFAFFEDGTVKCGRSKSLTPDEILNLFKLGRNSFAF